MNPTNDGGPAFPQPCTEEGFAANSPYRIAGGGLSMRDYFAAAALTGLLTKTDARGQPEDFAGWAYRYADAMLAARGGAK